MTWHDFSGSQGLQQSSNILIHVHTRKIACVACVKCARCGVLFTSSSSCRPWPLLKFHWIRWRVQKSFSSGCLTRTLPAFPLPAVPLGAVSPLFDGLRIWWQAVVHLLPFSSPRFRLPGSASCSMNPFQARSCETILDFFHSSPGDLQWTPGKETFDEMLATKNQPAPGPVVFTM